MGRLFPAALLHSPSAYSSTRPATLRRLLPPPARAAGAPATRASRLPRSRLLRRSFSAAMDSSKGDGEVYAFGPYKIDAKEVFYSTRLSYAFVNLRPILPGHVLVCPRHEVKRFIDLTPEETSDLWLTAQKVGGRLEKHYDASSLTLSIQDGPHAGQTVPHVHIHIIPRRANDFEKNDEIYDAMDVKEKELKDRLDLDKDRKDRTMEEMAEEADQLRALFI